MLAEIFTVTAPVFLLAAFGYSWVRFKKPFDLEFVSKICLSIATPCLVFSALAKAEVDPAAIRALTVASLAFYVGLAAIAATLLWGTRMSQRVWLAPFTFGNTGNIGLPLALLAFGEQGLAFAVVVFAAMIVLSFSVGVWVVSGEASPWTALKEPLLHATLLGSLFLVMDWSVPRWLDNTISLFGQVAIPLMLMTLGVSIARLPASAPWRTILFAAAKAVLSASLAVGLAIVFSLEGAARGAFIIQALTPVPVTSYLLAERFGADPAEVARFVVVSTLMSVAFLPVALALLM